MGEGLPGSHVLHLARDHGVFGGKHFLCIIIVDGMVHFDDGAVCGVLMAHAGKAVEGIAPEDAHIGVQCLEKLLAVLLVDLDIVHRDQHAPGVILGRGILLELHDLIVNRGRSADRELAQIHRQVILRLNGIRSSVGRLLHKFQAFQAKARRVCDVVRAIGDELTKRRLPVGGVGAIRRRGRRERPIPPRDHAEILILQCKRPAVQHGLLHGIVRRPYVPHIGKHLRGKRTKQQAKCQ